MGLAKVFFWGMVVSFLGTLPLSTLNIAAMQISMQESIRNAMYFSLGTIFTEMIYVRIALVGISWVKKQKNLFNFLIFTNKKPTIENTSNNKEEVNIMMSPILIIPNLPKCI